MKDNFIDWKDYANSQLPKALALSLTLLLFGVMVTPKIEVKKQVFKSQQMELVDIPMEEREKIEPPQTELNIEIPLVIGEELSTEAVNMEDYIAALEKIGKFDTTTAASLTKIDETPVDFVAYEDPPIPLTRISPEYPEIAKRTNTQGTVMLEVEILKDGSVRNIVVRRSVIGLDDAAIEAVRKTKFQPGKSSGRPVDVKLIIPIEFKLK
ncbi:MAG: energy transducer TonB [Candidatus Cloacimonetes bacterium]|nr:energy transducer TonB [Candidatus Cloacimonadota bacterium]